MTFDDPFGYMDHRAKIKSELLDVSKSISKNLLSTSTLKLSSSLITPERLQFSIN